MSNPTTAVPTSYYVLLDRTIVPAPVWVLTVRADRNQWVSGVDRPRASIPADLDSPGGEESRLILWLATELQRVVILDPLPGTARHVYRVSYADEEGGDE